ncbi:putative metal ion transporter [Zalerion maritima]|uniref:Metal ion transporter n=1 Tax=Zalerion maritima TaxID=339359 RepID=A0AAD5RN47_9PEZI|nr:putative metal ion transporter [Zalerion maritima]
MESDNSAGPSSPPLRRKSLKAGKKKRQRRKSFAPPMDERREGDDAPPIVPAQDPTPKPNRNNNFYSPHGRNISNTSIDSEALLDHRERPQFLRPRRASTVGLTSYRNSPAFHTSQSASKLPTLRRVPAESDHEDEYEPDVMDENSPLLTSELRKRGSNPNLRTSIYGGREGTASGFRSRRDSQSSSQSKRSKKRSLLSPFGAGEPYNVNYPPSMPGTPPNEASSRVLDLSMSYGDAMLREEIGGPGSPSISVPLEEEILPPGFGGRRGTVALQAEEDVCFPQDGLSEMAEDDMHHPGHLHRTRGGRRRRGKWPDLSHLDEWSTLEKIGEERRAKKITEPTLVNGRLRPSPGNKGWYKTEEETPYRFTYFNEELQSTIHSHTLSELAQGSSFKELFIPEPPLLSESESDDEEDPNPFHNEPHPLHTPSKPGSLVMQPTQSQSDSLRRECKEPMTNSNSQRTSGGGTSPAQAPSPLSKLKSSQLSKPPRYGDRPVWWLDIYRPTDDEMRVLSKTFGIHPLTAEDIMLEEAREKVELFRHYYFVNYRTFDQDVESETYLQPVNMYVVVFREGVLSFHFALTPHGANVRRRVRQLSDYLTVSSDWISYAIIDDITDVFVPLIQKIEDEVDEIDDAILKLHSSDFDSENDGSGDKKKDPEKWGTASSCASISGDSGSDMLRWVGDCRKRVMSLYRLLGNKADVIKGFAKRCNEHWEVAPRSDIGLYLGDIQDHIVTMTSNLSHYEKILARSHGNYLAQINIRMNERQEQTTDVLNKLTVLGTIVLPMNIITGLWGMNVWVPGQEYEGDLKWFFAITAGLLAFGMTCFWIAKRMYGIV